MSILQNLTNYLNWKVTKQVEAKNEMVNHLVYLVLSESKILNESLVPNPTPETENYIRMAMMKGVSLALRETDAYVKNFN